MAPSLYLFLLLPIFLAGEEEERRIQNATPSGSCTSEGGRSISGKGREWDHISREGSLIFFFFPGIDFCPLWFPGKFLTADLIKAFGPFRHCMMGGCLGCYNKPTLVDTTNVPSKRLTIQGRSGKKHSTSEDFWTTSNCDMDNSAALSQGSISSISTTNPALDLQGGLLLWNQTQQRWIGHRRSVNRTQHTQEPKLSWNATYESLLGSNKPFPQPIPLTEMVDFLVDIWEQEGLYD
ncbi:DUF4050 family protein [Quillaja saponaria]|uniref:DUF4050 family protein n=1 Tax=Quillaja saponaria TaxID=32244 RepID=A0AAD7LTM0_QUISA|nr:DUF4050 family protein [Quillaja saponaria]